MIEVTASGSNINTLNESFIGQQKQPESKSRANKSSISAHDIGTTKIKLKKTVLASPKEHKPSSHEKTTSSQDSIGTGSNHSVKTGVSDQFSETESTEDQKNRRTKRLQKFGISWKYSAAAESPGPVTEGQASKIGKQKKTPSVAPSKKSNPSTDKVASKPKNPKSFSKNKLYRTQRKLQKQKVDENY